ncbi:RING finger protein 148 [Zootoca vivipara]|uniref:RING finger protein 148 n=1 Tax=Zootoca vivipara TaxID=8524 RepID=UPI00159126C2|nr:RING finger protein 148 [Zootoca vivipara]
MSMPGTAVGRGRATSLCYLHLGLLLALCMHSSEVDAFWVANLNISFIVANRTLWEILENGVFAKASPLKKVSGVVVPPEGLHQNACSSFTHFKKPANGDSWLALIMRGRCSFAKQITMATERGAAGVIIYNYPGTGNAIFPMHNFGAEGIVSVMISNLKGIDLLHLAQNGIQVRVTIDVGKHHYPWITHYMGTIFVFASLAVAYCTCYSATRLRRSRNLVQRCPQELDIDKAMNYLELRTLKKDDKEVGSSGESCAVCLEMYKPKDITRVLHCRHLFHKACVDPWLLNHQTCPVCKWDMLRMVESIATEAESLGSQMPNEVSPTISSPKQ